MTNVLRHFLKRYGGVVCALAMALAFASLGGSTASAASVLTSDNPTNGNYLPFLSDDLKESQSVISTSSQNMPYLFNFYGQGTASSKQYLWSTKPTFDLSHPVSMSYWVKVPASNTDSTGIDNGFAFVLAKSNQQTTSNSAAGETLGVYSDPTWTSHSWSGPTISSDNLSSAIQNSLAIEFDTYANAGTGVASLSNSEYDYGTTPAAPHVAWAYPAQTNSYAIQDGTVSGFLGIGKYWRMTMTHNGGTTATSLPTGRWVHMTLVYNGDTSNPVLTYYVDDRDENGDAKTVTGVQIPLNFGNLGITSSDRKLYWGFTSFNTMTSTSMANSVIFDGYSEAYLPDVSLGVNGQSYAYDSLSSLGDATKGTQTVHNGDALTYDTSLNGIRQESIDNASVTTKLPTGMSLVADDGVYGQVTYTEEVLSNPVTVTQDITAADVTDNTVSLTLGNKFQNAMRADSTGIRRGDLKVRLNTTVAATPGTTLDALMTNIKSDAIDEALAGPKLKIADNTASTEAYNGTQKVFPSDSKTTADASATSLLTKSGSTLKYDYKLADIGVGALNGASLAVTKPTSLTWATDGAGDIGKITYTDNASKTNTQNITAADVDATGHVLLKSSLLDGISQGDLKIELNHNAIGAENTVLASEQVDLQVNGATIQTFKSPSLKIAPNLVTSGSVKVQDLNYADSATPTLTTNLVSQQDTVRYTYTINYDASQSVDSAWRNLQLKPNLMQPSAQGTIDQDYLELRRVYVNGELKQTSTGHTPNEGAGNPNGFTVDLGDLDSTNVDADGQATLTVTLDYELGSLPADSTTNIAATTATVSGTSGTSGTQHTIKIDNPAYGLSRAATSNGNVAWNNTVAMPYLADGSKNQDAYASQVKTITKASPDGKYVFTGKDKYIVLSGDVSGVSMDNVEMYVEDNGKLMKGPFAASSKGFSYWYYAFKRSGFSGEATDDNPSNPIDTIGTLRPGVNEIRVYAVDKTTGRRLNAGNTTDVTPYIEFTIVDPAPSLSVNNDIHFGDTTLSGTSQYVATTENTSAPFSLKVLYADYDTYNWTVSAATSPFTSGGNKLRGELLYQKDGKALTISDATQPLYSDQSGVNDATQVTSNDTDSDGTYDIAGKWTHDAYNANSSTGLYMHVFPDAVADEGSSNYTGTITWTFSSTPTTSSN